MPQSPTENPIPTVAVLHLYTFIVEGGPGILEGEHEAVNADKVIKALSGVCLPLPREAM